MHCDQCTMRNSALSNNTTVGSKTKGVHVYSGASDGGPSISIHVGTQYNRPLHKGHNWFP